VAAQTRFDATTGKLEDRKTSEPKFRVGDKVRLTRRCRIHDGVFIVSSSGVDVSSNLMLYSCYRVNEKGHTIWFSCGESVLEEVGR